MADDFDAAMAIIDPDMLENSTEMLSHANSVIENLLSAKNSGQHRCHLLQNLPVRIRIDETQS